MITISLGSVGSGKTACSVRDLYLNKANRKTYSNIITSKLKNVVTLDSSMIIKKELVKTVTRKNTGVTEAVYDYRLNKEFWQNIKEPINVVLDEAHSIINSRRAMSKVNIVVTDWLALIRRVLGESPSGHGELVFITQLPNRIDIIAREMANLVKYHICHYRKTCSRCGCSWNENTEMPETFWQCFNCGSNGIKKYNHMVEVIYFSGMESYKNWRYMGIKSYFKRIVIRDIEKYFKYYDTLQWDSMFSDVY